MSTNEQRAELEQGAAAAPPLPSSSVVHGAGEADFSRREFVLRELMDEPCTYADWAAAARDLAQCNRLTRGYQPTLEFLERVATRTGMGYEPLHVVDVGCGHGDTLRTIHRWAAKRSLPLRLTGIDLNPYATRLARECDRREQVPAKRIAWITGDLFATSLEQPADVVISSLVAHHLSDVSIGQLLRWMEAEARVGWFVSDLERAEKPAKLFGWMAHGLRWHRFLKHDGPVSFRRALSLFEWEALGAGYGARVFAAKPARVCVERLPLANP